MHIELLTQCSCLYELLVKLALLVGFNVDTMNSNMVYAITGVDERGVSTSSIPAFLKSKYTCICLLLQDVTINTVRKYVWWVTLVLQKQLFNGEIFSSSCSYTLTCMTSMLQTGASLLIPSKSLGPAHKKLPRKLRIEGEQ
jgi:hypothetical protein